MDTKSFIVKGILFVVIASALLYVIRDYFHIYMSKISNVLFRWNVILTIRVSEKVQ